ncbi:hypothetical protein EZV62_018648 [Acer yangbiense]|uniref:Protein kinase domain-containing protein n=1 Tax=Acer yangbiense TaxID=1000413 RepID=A0A5C7HKP8_9ROSI|nr:hypothetical protein EZV62_018648 [Acer yangbiense]
MTVRVPGFDSFREMFDSDPYFSGVIAAARTGENSEFLLVDGFLFRGNQLCIPDCSLRLQIIKESHGEGHVGRDRNGNNTAFGLKLGNGNNTAFGLKLGFGIGGPVLLIVALSIYITRCRRKGIYASPNSRYTSSDPSSKSDLEAASAYFGVPIFPYSELAEATNNFNHEKELGDGGFGTVYYGKKINFSDHLHGDRTNPCLLTWSIRMNIAIETASALAYLHASDIIHRDVKTNNILLDNNFCVKVADFGLSRLFPTNVTHVSTAPQGTPGYVNPEYHQCYQLTDKSDVYSFGVVLIELISSMRAVDISRHRNEINLANLAINRIQKHAVDELVDPCLGFHSDDVVKRSRAGFSMSATN